MPPILCAVGTLKALYPHSLKSERRGKWFGFASRVKRSCRCAPAQLAATTAANEVFNSPAQIALRQSRTVRTPAVDVLDRLAVK